MNETRIDRPSEDGTMAEILYDYAVLRGDLTERYAREQLLDIIARRQAYAVREAKVKVLEEVTAHVDGVASVSDGLMFKGFILDFLRRTTAKVAQS